METSNNCEAYIVSLVLRFVNPMMYGRYPSVMQKLVGSRLPSFKSEESAMLRGSFDFIGFNHYAVAFLRAATDNPDDDFRDWYTDMSVIFACKLLSLL